MKKSELNTYIRNYILPTHPDYYLDEYVMYKTFGDNFFIKGYLFYSKGDNETGLKVTCFVMPLYVKDDAISYTIGKELYFIQNEGFLKKTKNIWWNVRKENQPTTFQQINHMIDEQGEPVLKKFNSSKDFYELHKGERKDNIRIYEEVAYSAILFGEMPLQEKMLKGLIREAENERDVDWVHQIKADAHLLLALKNVEERIIILKRWANETMSQLKLSKLIPFTL